MHGSIRLTGAAILAASCLMPAAAIPQGGGSIPGRKTWTLQNDKIRLLIAPGGGHIASATLRSGRGAGVNPLWIPPWKSVEPGGWIGREAAYGGRPAAQLLCCILGHNLCLDFFGAPSPEETSAGVPVHGEAPCVTWTLRSRSATSITYRAKLPLAQMNVTRTIKLTPGSTVFWITETVENLSAFDRPIGWQQHVTLGSPFLAAGQSFFDIGGGWSTTDTAAFSAKQRLKKAAEFEWPDAPGANGDTVNLRAYPGGAPNSDFTVTAVDPSRQWGWFTAANPRKGVLIGYVWPRKDYPWAANWEENHARDGKPWLGKAVARGIEFGTTPFAHSRREMVTLGRLHGIPTYRWIPAKGKQSITYAGFVAPAPAALTAVKDVRVTAGGIALTPEGAGAIHLPGRR